MFERHLGSSRLAPSSADTANLPAPAGGMKRASDFHLMMALGSLMAFTSVATDMYLPALPALSTVFGVDPGRVQITVSAFLIGFSVGRLLWGPIGDRYGRRIPIAVGVVLFIIGSVGCALSGSVEQMLVWRVVQSIGACAGSVLARAMMSDLYNKERLSQGLSTLMMVSSVAPLVGPVLGGQILAYASWEAIFWTIAAFGLASLIGIMSLPETLPKSQRIEESIPASLASYARLLAKPRLVGFAVSGGFFYAGIYAYIAGTPFAYIDFHHVSPQAYGLLFGVNIFGIMAANMLNRRLVMKFGTERMLLLGGSIAALAGMSLSLTAGLGWGGVLGLAVPLFVYVSMAGLIIANSVAGALVISPQRAGVASALVGAIQFGMGVLGSAMVAWLADGTPWTMGWVVGASGIGCLLTAVPLVRMKESASRA
jgi:DHA1 family bicyclomycin/chloramphenicol resistance-like MFS transporter